MSATKTLTFVTKNKEKIDDITEMIGSICKIKFTADIELIEIQSIDVEEVVAFKAKQAFEKLKKPVVVSDSGLEITALNRFPGALVKFANETLGQEKIVKLLEDETNRQVFFVAAIAYCDTNGDVKTFIERDEGTVALKPRGKGWHFDRIFIPIGEERTWAEIGRKKKNVNSAFRRALQQFVNFLEKNKVE
jgi:XTP/dITP diphosphohydrolase